MFGRRRQVVQPLKGEAHNREIMSLSQLVHRSKDMPDMAWGPAGPLAGSTESAANHIPTAFFFAPEFYLRPERPGLWELRSALASEMGMAASILTDYSVTKFAPAYHIFTSVIETVLTLL